MTFFSREPMIQEADDARLTISGKFPAIVVTYGDHVVHNLLGLTLEIAANELPEVTLRVRPGVIEVDAESMAAFEAVFDRKVVTPAELKPSQPPTTNDYRGRKHYTGCVWVRSHKRKLSESDCTCGKGMGVDRPVWGDVPTEADV